MTLLKVEAYFGLEMRKTGIFELGPGLLSPFAMSKKARALLGLDSTGPGFGIEKGPDRDFYGRALGPAPNIGSDWALRPDLDRAWGSLGHQAKLSG